MPVALLGLGGNIGDPAASMGFALRALDARSDTAVLSVSRLFRTPPWGKTDQPAFLNAAARIETVLGARSLLDACFRIEGELKRERLERWGPRTIDLDLLDYEGIVLGGDRLVLPHPRMADRAFVLVPLADVAPDFVLNGEAVAVRLAALDRSGIEPLGEARDWWRA